MTPDRESIRLRDDAATAARRAGQARALADAIDQRLRPLAHRLEPVRRLHTEGVWASRAATTSRVVLERVIAAHVWLAHDDLGRTRVALERRADELDRAARAAHERADAIDAAAAAASGP